MYWVLNLLFIKKKHIPLNLELFKKQDVWVESNFLFKFNYSFVSKNIIKKNFLLCFLKFNNKNLYISNNLNSFYIFNFIKNINLLFYNDNKFLFLDSSLNYILPFYHYHYNYYNLLQNKNFFFLKKKFLTQNNFSFYYIKFIKNNNINCLIVLDYLFFEKFFSIFLKTNLPIFSIINKSNSNIFVDYYFYSNLINNSIIKIILYNYIISLFFNYYNIKNFFKKKIFIKRLKLLNN